MAITSLCAMSQFFPSDFEVRTFYGHVTGVLISVPWPIQCCQLKICIFFYVTYVLLFQLLCQLSQLDLAYFYAWNYTFAVTWLYSVASLKITIFPSSDLYFTIFFIRNCSSLFVVQTFWSVYSVAKSQISFPKSGIL